MKKIHSENQKMFFDERKTLEQINKKWVKVLTVITYVILVSLVALILGLYYKLAWNPKYDFENFKNNDFEIVHLGSVEIKHAKEAEMVCFNIF